jgi:hypothetical protein
MPDLAPAPDALPPLNLDGGRATGLWPAGEPATVRQAHDSRPARGEKEAHVALTMTTTGTKADMIEFLEAKRDGHLGAAESSRRAQEREHQAHIAEGLTEAIKVLQSWVPVMDGAVADGKARQPATT